MKRRHFITNTLMATGGAMIGTNIIFSKAMEEINQQFSDHNKINGYDLIINGAGLAGYFAAIEASKIGLRVLILDKRTSAGYDLAWKKKLWISSEGLKGFNREHFDLFFPEGEAGEISPGYTEPQNQSQPDDELLLFAGSIKKGLLRNLLINKVHVMLMTDVCGIISDNTNVTGVLVANKHGLYTINCKSFLDATENNLFTLNLFNQKYKIAKAGFVFELINVDDTARRVFSVDKSLAILNNSIVLHKSKKSNDQRFIEFEFPVEDIEMSAIEQKARFLSARLGKMISSVDPCFNKAKLNRFASECSLFLEKKITPKPLLKGYYCSENADAQVFSCTSILNIAAASKLLVGEMKITDVDLKTRVIHFIGGTTKLGITEKFVNENGINLPLAPFVFDQKMNIQEEKCQVLVAGGGTAGATAALGAVRDGVSVTLVEYFNDLGGTKTCGGVSAYYLGLSSHPFITGYEKGILEHKNEFNLSGGTERSFYLLDSLRNAGCKIISGTILCGAIKENNKITGVILCENGRLRKMICDIAIDSTGDADIAFFAGINYEHGNSRTGISQNYSQWDVPGRFNMPSNINRDYDIIDNTKISELQRGLFLSHYESHFYDLYPMLTVRESRRPEGIYTLNIRDVLGGAHFEDVISRSFSDFDPHYIGSSEYSRCGFLLPHTNKSTVEIPFRSIVPKDIDGLLFSGKAISVTNNAIQFTRMSADVTVLGYVTGQIASEIVLAGISPRDYKVTQLQTRWRDNGFLTVTHNEKTETTNEVVSRLSKDEKGYLLKCCLLPEKDVLPVLLNQFKTTNSIQLAKALAWFSNSAGVHLILNELNELFKEELLTRNNGYSEKYDPYSLYWRINQDIGLLGMSRDKRSRDIIVKILNDTTSGGEVITYLEDNQYNSNRIDLRLIPYHNRITNLCFYIERMPDRIFIAGLEKLLTDENIKGFRTTEYNNTRWRVFRADLELYIAAALARCGSKASVEILIDYLDEVHSNLRGFACSELKNLFGQDFGYDTSGWKNYINNKIQFPHKATGIVKQIEL